MIGRSGNWTPDPLHQQPSVQPLDHPGLFVTLYLMTIDIFAKFLTISTLFLSKYSCPCLWSFDWAMVKYKRANRKAMHDLIFYGNSNFYDIYHHFRVIRSLKRARPWSWPLELVRIKCKYANRKPIRNLLFDDNGNFHHIIIFQDIPCRNVHVLDLDLKNGSRSSVILQSKSYIRFTIVWQQ